MIWNACRQSGTCALPTGTGQPSDIRSPAGLEFDAPGQPQYTFGLEIGGEERKAGRDRVPVPAGEPGSFALSGCCCHLANRGILEEQVPFAPAQFARCNAKVLAATFGKAGDCGILQSAFEGPFDLLVLGKKPRGPFASRGHALGNFGRASRAVVHELFGAFHEALCAGMFDRGQGSDCGAFDLRRHVTRSQVPDSTMNREKMVPPPGLEPGTPRSTI